MDSNNMVNNFEEIMGSNIMVITVGIFLILIIVMAIDGFKKELKISKYRQSLKSYYDRCVELNCEIEGLLTKESKFDVIEADSKVEFEKMLEQLKKWSNKSYDRYGKVHNLKLQFDFNEQKDGKYLCFAEYDLLVLKKGVTKHEYNKLVKEHNEIAEKHNNLKEEKVFSITLIDNI